MHSYEIALRKDKVVCTRYIHNYTFPAGFNWPLSD